MPIEMPKGLPFAVDTWSSESARKRHHFLSHAHRDHLAGIVSRASYPIYATRVTITIVLSYFPQLDEANFVEIKVGETLVINDADGVFSVTACDANHCPGAVMFIFEGTFGNILHTGDCRLTADCLQDLPLNYITKRGKAMVSRFDLIFLDCTFGRCFLKLPRKQSAIQQVINCIWKHPHAPFIYLACDLLGHEEILVEVSRTFGSQIFVDQAIYHDRFSTLSLIAPHVVSNDPSSRFQVVGFPGLYQRAREAITNAKANHQPTPLFIRPSTQWYASKVRAHTPSVTEPEQDEFGVWHVCFSIHSSREELELALQFLQPKWVISTTPPSLAMELSYVKKHCFTTRWIPDDPLWRIFKFSFKKTISVPPLVETEMVPLPVSVGVPADVLEQVEIELESTQAITLFGRARFGILDEFEIIDEEKLEYISLEECNLELDGRLTEELTTVERRTDELRIDGKEKNEKRSNYGQRSIEELHVEDRKMDNGETTKPSEEEKKDLGFERDRTCIGSSKELNQSLKRLYRSRNVPVPRPLPSLVELMEASKRVKMGEESSNCSTLNSKYGIP
ncbi:DNA repair metallo-beta-lactamase family protein [Rhynchospora pubera]|uniref:DNA repair metallo-beta-lactamase family protein n=1 Tax=Rhynchospora pubera TaxID=906938 RepID=A0AAV8H7B4_9POAL|nr:DNA repair metallo-beta-lactamase family protein [Rhynchospora pubera]